MGEPTGRNTREEPRGETQVGPITGRSGMGTQEGGSKGENPGERKPWAESQGGNSGHGDPRG